MIHVYFGLVYKPHPDDEKVPVAEAYLKFLGDKKQVQAAEQQYKKDKKKFTKPDWFEKDDAIKKNDIANLVRDHLQWFAESGFIPSGEVAKERIFYKPNCECC